MQNQTRKSSTPIKVYCLPSERALIAEKARSAGLSESAYLRRVGVGFEVQSVIDSRQVVALAKINGDQGRLGGLLKLWLTNDERFAGFNEEKTKATIRAVLARIEDAQAALLEVVKKA